MSEPSVRTGTHATVRSFEPDRSGTAVTDGGRVVAFGAAAFEASGLHLLRPGQRVRLVGDPVRLVTLSTFADPA